MAHADPPKEKSLQAVRTTTPPKLDGLLDDPAWQTAPIATDFVQYEPVNGAPPLHQTEVRLLYDDNAIYVGAMLHDDAPDSILQQLCRRDGGDEANADYFGVAFDTYNDNLNAFVFGVSACGVQTDYRYSALGVDFVWDGVWKSEVALHDKGWSVEFEIPYSALRFSGQEVQDWGLQFRRTIRRVRQTTTWNPMDRSTEGSVNQFGVLEGLHGLKPPFRLSLTPYVSGYVQRYSPGKGNVGQPATSQYLNAGADLKYGLSESFTLDMTLVPDFGQVVSDNQVLNLSPFEVQFQENRPFFTEGVELFNIANVFYSRRVGGTPRQYYAVYDSVRENETLTTNPSKTRLLNAFKLSGRTKGNSGLGIFNGMTAPSYAEISSATGSRRIQTQAFTNYNVTVFDQAFRNNSYLSFINTNRLEANGYTDNVTATRFRLSDANNRYFVSGSGALSQQWTPGTAMPTRGYAYNYKMGKASGNFIFDVGQNVESNAYDPTAMGFLLSNNEFSDFGRVAYRIFKPVWKFVALNHVLAFNHTSLFQPRRYANLDVSLDGWYQLKSYDFFGWWIWGNPRGGYDFFEPRVAGRQFRYAAGGGYGGFISTNYARRFAIDLEVDAWGRPEMDWWTFRYSVQPRVRVSDKVSFNHSFWHNVSRNEVGFVNFDSLGNSLLGTRTRRDIENILTFEYTFTNRMAFSCRARHIWSGVHYHRIDLLNDEGGLAPTTYSENHDINFNAFNVDAVFQWRFAPGSDIFVVWKTNVLHFGDRPQYAYLRNVQGTFEAPQTNSLSVRVLYYIDVGRLAARRGSVG